MKILLIRPVPEKETIGLQHVMICEPLELEYLSSAVKGPGVEVIIADMILEKRSIDEIIADFKPDLVGLTGYITHVSVIKKIAESIKKITSCYIAVGGVHAEVVPGDFKSEFIDFIIFGNGIETFRELVAALIKSEDPEKIEGIWHENKKKPRVKLQIDQLFPDRSAVKKYRRHYYYMFHNPCALIKTSIGCNYRCKFCFCHKITDGVSMRRDPSHVADELESIPEEEIYIVDDNFLHDSKWLKVFIAHLKERDCKKKFLVYGRADFIARNPELIKSLKEVGLRAVIVGLESFSSEELDIYNKNSSRSLNEEAVKVLNSNSIECYGTFITGIDWKLKDFWTLFLWINRLGLMFVNLQPFTPYPGTDIYDEYRDKLCIKRSDHGKWDLAHLALNPGNMSKRAYYGLIFILYYLVTMNPFSILKMIKRYGLKPVLKLGMGSSKITRQYIEKVIYPNGKK